MTASFTLEGEGWRGRIATPADSDVLCRLFRSIHVKSALELTQERDPDFFEMLRMHLGGYETFLFENDAGDVIACSSIARRDGWLDGARIPTGYFCDLRIAPGFRGGRVLAQAYAPCMEWTRQQYGGEVFNTVVFDSNKQAIAALVGRDGEVSEKRAGQPVYREMTPFRMTSVQFTTARPAPERPVREAGPADRDELFAFIAAGQKRRVLGECLDEEVLERRLATWPGLTLGDFLVARGGDGRIAGCLAPWDTGAFKRTRVIGYHGSMAWFRHAYDLAARVRRFPPLPRPGECFRFAFLTHLEIAGDDPAVLRDLLRAAYRRLRPSGAHFMSAMVPRGSPLEAAFAGFTVNRTGMTLYAVHARGSRYAAREFGTLHPGFEMALS
jgi:hypothetical protein